MCEVHMQSLRVTSRRTNISMQILTTDIIVTTIFITIIGRSYHWNKNYFQTTYRL